MTPDAARALPSGHVPALLPARCATSVAKSFSFWTTVSADYIREDMPNIPILITATSFWRKRKQWYAEIPEARLPGHLTMVGVDSGGFVASRILGDYPFTLPQYVRWLYAVRPLWDATMDFCCEDEITNGKPGIVRQRQQRTTDGAWLAWLAYRDVSWRWMPTIQGWTVEDYAYHARQMKPLIDDMRNYYGDAFAVGIGTLCKRASAEMIRRVVKAVSWELPGIKFHLWGVKLNAFQGALATCVVSSDSAAWHTSGSYANHKSAFKASGMSKRAYEWKYALPEYLRRVDATRTFAASALPLFAAP